MPDVEPKAVLSTKGNFFFISIYENHFHFIVKRNVKSSISLFIFTLSLKTKLL